MKQDREEELELVIPTKEYQKEVEEYLQEFIEYGENKIAGIGGLDRLKDFNQWLEKVQNDMSSKIINEEKVPSTVYLTIRKSDKKIVGNLQIRHRLNKKLLNYGGHIGDSIRPSERKKGYATEQIRLALKKCRELGIDNVLMDCDKSNIGSAKSIMNNGGILENEVYVDNVLIQRYWISLKKKYAGKFTKDKVNSLIYKQISFDENNFKGDVCYYDFIDVKKKITIPNGKFILENQYKWLEFYDYNSKVRLTAIYNEKNEIVEWYFDIAKIIGKENGTPFEDDLYLDVVVTPEGKIVLLDEDELEEAYSKLEVNKIDYDMAYQEANLLMSKLKNKVRELKRYTDKYLEKMMCN